MTYLENHLPGKSTVINLQNFPISTYILYIKTEEGYHHFKIIKVKVQKFLHLLENLHKWKIYFYLFIVSVIVSSCIVYQKGQDGKPNQVKNAEEIANHSRKTKN